MKPRASPVPKRVIQRKLVGVATGDFGLFADVVAVLKSANIRFVSFDPLEPAPGNVGVIITSAAEVRPDWVAQKPVEEPTRSGSNNESSKAPDLKEAGMQLAQEVQTSQERRLEVKLTTPEGAPASEAEARWKGRRLITLDLEHKDDKDRELELNLLPFRALWALQGYPLLRVGVDPGPRPGLAILCPQGLLFEAQTRDEEQALGLLIGILRYGGPGQLVVRVGHGAPLPRNRLINGLMGAAMALWGSPADENGSSFGEETGPCDDMWVPAGPTPERPLPPGLAIEVVDESGSSSRPRAHSNTTAAAIIATLPGFRLRKPLHSHVKPADIAKVQEHSRRRTNGRKTLSANLAEAVATGQLSLKEALELDA